MPQSNYQEPIEKEDLDLAKKLRPEADQPLAGKENIPVTGAEKTPEGVEAEVPEKPEAPLAEKAPEVEVETGREAKPEEVSEKVETARKAIQAQKPAPAVSVAGDAQVVSQITEYEKKIEKLVELALQKGPEHAIKVARHLDKGKDLSQADNYTLDEIHDRLLEDDLRKQLVQKGLLKEL
jgi:hypothetical protein